MLLLMHFRSHPITCHVIHSHHTPAFISLSLQHRLSSVPRPHPIEQPQHNPETETEIRDASQPAPSKRHKSNLRTPNAQNRHTPTEKPGAGGDRKKKKSVWSEMHEANKNGPADFGETGKKMVCKSALCRSRRLAS